MSFKTFAVGDAKIITKETTSGIFLEEAVIIWKSSVQKSTVYLNSYETKWKTSEFENLYPEYKRYTINLVLKVIRLS